jgi:hypothetical protein
MTFLIHKMPYRLYQLDQAVRYPGMTNAYHSIDHFTLLDTRLALQYVAFRAATRTHQHDTRKRASKK